MTETDTSSSRRRWLRPGWIRNVSMSTRLAVAVVLVTVTSLIVTSILSLTYGEDLAGNLVDSQLETRASSKAQEMSRYLAAMEARTAALATSPGIAVTSARFVDAYNELTELEGAAIEEVAAPVAAFYRSSFAPALSEVTGSPVSWRTLVPVGRPALYLQRHYVTGAEDQIAEPGLVDDAADGSTWSAVHQQAHLGLLEIVERLGATDLYLIDPDSGNIVYSAAKKPDFATSLDLGPYGGSTLAAAMRAVRDAPERSTVTVLDMAPYAPDLSAPVLFMASPVFEGNELVAILALKIPTAALDEIMTSGGRWVEEGLGESGETFLVGPDGRMRSVARPLAAEPVVFLEELAAAGTATQEEQHLIEATGTTAGFLRVADGRELTTVVAAGKPTSDGTNYLVQPVLRSVQPLDAADLGWFVVSEMERDEVEGPITDYRRALIIAIAVFVIGITFATVTWSRGVFRPVRNISEKLRRIHDGEDHEDIEPDPRAPTDLVEISNHIDEMLVALHRREADLHAASAERLDTVRSLLPAELAERVEAGDRNVIDRVPQAGIAVLVMEGFGAMLRSRSTETMRTLLTELVSELDALAQHHGLSRVKLVGDAYFAGCGLTQPFLDSAPRSVAFALEARDVVREVSARHGDGPQIAVGVHSGPVNVGLTGSARLVYDVWGDTVNTTVMLARSAQAGEVLVTETVKRLLPADYAATPREGGPETSWAVTGQLANRGTDG